MEANQMSWQIDNAHSQVQFSVRHMMISNARGRFENFSGTVQFDDANPTNSSVEVQIEAASINTREPNRDNHLRSPDFLDVAQFPNITFKSTRLEKVDDQNGRITGDLTIRGVSHPVVLEVEYAGQSKMWGRVSAGFSATAKFNRKDWGLVWNQTLESGGLLVGDQIQVSIELEIVQVPETVADGQTVTA
jgi:polyisoprenoid-binding protein YceI